MKRFWDTASPVPDAEGFAIELDGRPMRLPGGTPLRIISPRLAQAIAAEWQAAGKAKGGEMSYADTPLTRLAGTAQDRIAPDPAPVIDAIARYGQSDLLCYRADTPPALIQRQAEHWQPWLDWAALHHDAHLKVTSGVMYVRQDPQAIAALRAAVARNDAPVLAALGVAVPALGSVVLGLALADGRLTAEEAHRIAALDELFQAEFWGEDADAAARRAQVAADIAVAARFMELARA